MKFSLNYLVQQLIFNFLIYFLIYQIILFKKKLVIKLSLHINIGIK